MKRKLKIGDVELTILDVPAGAYRFMISFGSLYYCTEGGPWLTLCHINKCKIIGTWPGITEDQAALIVESIGVGYYKNYSSKLPLNLKTAIESFDSFMRANELYTENPCGFKPQLKQYSIHEDEQKYFPADLAEWQLAQEKTFPLMLILQ